MSHDQITTDLKAKLVCQQDEICLLKGKLFKFDDILAQNSDLKCQVKSLKRWMEDAKTNDEQMKKTLLNNYDIQTEKLRNLELTECKVRSDNKRLTELNECLTEKICKTEENEKRLKYENNNLEVSKNRALDELCNMKNKIKEMDRIIENLTKSSTFKEDEYCNLRCEFDECKSENERLNDVCRHLNIDLESTKSDLVNMQLETKQTVERLKLQNETISKELEVKCKKLRITTIEFNEAKEIIANDKCNIQKLETLIVKLREAAEKDQCELNMKIHKLKKEISIKDELVCRVKSQFSDLQRQNECLLTDIKILKNQFQANECQLEKIKHCNLMLEKNIHQLEKKNNSLVKELKCQQKKIVEFEHYTCCLEEKIKQQELNKCCTQCVSCPPSCIP